MEVFVGRQPIFDRNTKVAGYELFFRDSDTGSARVLDGDAATSTVIYNAFAEFGLETLTRNQPAFLNMTRRFLLEQPVDLPQAQVVLEVLDDAQPDAELVEALRALSERGYRIALEGFVVGQGRDRLVPLVDIVKVDVTGMKAPEIVRDAERLREAGARQLLAEKIETPGIFEVCRNCGFDYFQGYFLERPSTIHRRALTAGQQAVLQLVSELQGAELDTNRLESIIASDVGLSYKLLRYLASPLFARHGSIDSIREGIVYLGRREIQSWGTMIALHSVSERPPELMVTLLMRGRMCALLCRQEERALDPQTAFMVGLFSGIDALLDRPMSELLEQLPLSDTVREALEHHSGGYGRLLRCAQALERARWTEAKELGYRDEAVFRAYMDAMRWANEQAAALAAG